jgi:hypothetical protein
VRLDFNSTRQFYDSMDEGRPVLVIRTTRDIRFKQNGMSFFVKFLEIDITDLLPRSHVTVRIRQTGVVFTFRWALITERSGSHVSVGPGHRKEWFSRSGDQ